MRLTPAMLLLVLAAVTSLPARAQVPLVADLSDHLVAITTGFAGAKVLLFGATDKRGDVVVVVRGPTQLMVVHRKSRVLGVWVNTASMTFREVPSFFAIAASGPLEEIATEAVRDRHQLGIEHLELPLLGRSFASDDIKRQWQEALRRNQQRSGLYGDQVSEVNFLGSRLFRARVALPSNVPTGTYQVEVYLLRDGQVVSAQTTPLIVSRVGLEAEIFDFAHQNAAYYGLIAILVALVAGWLGNAVFRKA